MGEITPTKVIMIFGSLLTYTSLVYHFRTPESLSKGIRESKTGPYGPPNADFDWCEYNYEQFFYIAEPVNTFTGFFFILQSFLFFKLHEGIKISWEIYNLHLQVILLGIGTCLFHATLRYKMQLADEIPMMGLVISTSCFLLKQTNGILPYQLAGAFFIPLDILIVYSAGDKDGQVHHACRTVMILTFAGCFIHIFAGCL